MRGAGCGQKVVAVVTWLLLHSQNPALLRLDLIHYVYLSVWAEEPKYTRSVLHPIKCQCLDIITHTSVFLSSFSIWRFITNTADYKIVSWCSSSSSYFPAADIYPYMAWNYCHLLQQCPHWSELLHILSLENPMKGLSSVFFHTPDSGARWELVLKHCLSARWIAIREGWFNSASNALVFYYMISKPSWILVQLTLLWAQPPYKMPYLVLVLMKFHYRPPLPQTYLPKIKP